MKGPTDGLTSTERGQSGHQRTPCPSICSLDTKNQQINMDGMCSVFDCCALDFTLQC